MSTQRHTREENIARVREAGTELTRGPALAGLVRKLEIAEQTYRLRKDNARLEKQGAHPATK